MEHIKSAMDFLNRSLKEKDQHQAVSFVDFISHIRLTPERVLRNIFQIFHDMVKSYLGEGVNEYPDDPESVGFLHYDCYKLFVEGADHPFFADRIFANRFVDHVEALKSGAQQNKIYIFDGPPGCGKSTFLNNLLMRLEEYANTMEGCLYEAFWRLDREVLGGFVKHGPTQLADQFTRPFVIGEHVRDMAQNPHDFPQSPSPEHYTCEWSFPSSTGNWVEVACPSHDHPVFMIPKSIRREFLAELLVDYENRDRILNDREYDWIFRGSQCTICGALFDTLLDKLKTVDKVFDMIHVRPYRFNRRLGEGISVFNPGDMPMRQTVLTNPMLQQRLYELFWDSNQIHYIFSRFAKTNNGIYALMDIKSHNTERLTELHNVISEGVHKVEFIEENVNSLFMAVMNPEDKANISGTPSFTDRIQYIDVPYVLDYKTEVEIYRHIFGASIDKYFLPRVLNNFARVIISTRLEPTSKALEDWIPEPQKYHLYCDRNLLLLKMDLYTGYIPSWLSEEDRKAFTAKRRLKILGESKQEGKKGLSGRDSIKIFGAFFGANARGDKLINMAMLCKFFSRAKEELKAAIPASFLDSLLRMYNYMVLQEVKESLYYYNEDQISRDIQNYIFAVNFDIGTTEKNSYTGDHIEITEDFLQSIENRLLGTGLDEKRRVAFRRDVQKDYSSQTLTQEIMLEEKALPQTRLFQSLHERYVYNLKQKVLDPFLENENFHRAIKDYGGDDFKAYDNRIRDDVTFLIRNLTTRYGYSPQGAQEVCIYVIEEGLPKQFEG